MEYIYISARKGYFNCLGVRWLSTTSKEGYLMQTMPKSIITRITTVAGTKYL